MDFTFKGGSMENSFAYIHGVGGLMLAEDYPLSNNESSCQFNISMSKLQIDTYIKVLPHGDEEALKDAVAAVGPIAAAINVAEDIFFNYGTGVFSYENCNKEANHAILIVGYGNDPKFGPYWICKNSW